MADTEILNMPGRSWPVSLDDRPDSRLGLAPGPTADESPEARLHATAVRFEAAFLAEMLRHSGMGKMPSAFNGGAGEAAFTGSLIQEYASVVARAGGIGLADSIFKSLIVRSAE